MYHSANGAAGRLHQYQTKAKTAQQGITPGLHSHSMESCSTMLAAGLQGRCCQSVQSEIRKTADG